MKTIPKLIRNKIYKKLLNELLDIDTIRSFFICLHLELEISYNPSYKKYDRSWFENSILDVFPEFAKFKRLPIPNERGW